MKKFYLSPLTDRKYYGTGIEDQDGNIVLDIWGVNRLHKPSERELAKWTSEEPFEMCDTHYEDEGDLEVAQIIVKALNEHQSKQSKNRGEQ